MKRKEAQSRIGRKKKQAKDKKKSCKEKREKNAYRKQGD